MRYPSRPKRWDFSHIQMSKQRKAQNLSKQEADVDVAIEGEVKGLDESRQPRASTPKLPLVVAMVALLAVTGALLFGYRYWIEMKHTLVQLNSALVLVNQQQNQLAEKLQKTLQNFELQQKEIATQRDELAQQAKQIKQDKEASHQQGVQLYRSLSEVQARLGGREGLWRVAEAEYLMRIASYRLTLMGDAATAVEALKSADERLSASGDPAWTGVREELAHELTRLKGVPNVDLAGISAELNALSDQIEKLPLQDEGTARSLAEYSLDTAAVAGNSDQPVKQVLDDLWQGFKSLVVIRDHDRPVTAMLAPEQRYFLLQNLRLKLENAKVALMEHSQFLYVDNLNAAAKWVDAYFQTSDPVVAGFTGQLQALAARNIAPDLPDISGSLRALQAKREEMSVHPRQAIKDKRGGEESK